MHKLLLVLIIWFSAPPSAWAAGDSEEGGVLVKVPKRLQGQGYKLRLLDEEFIFGKDILFYDNPISYDVKLLDSGRRIMDSAIAAPHRNFFRNLYPNAWRITATAGASHFDRDTHRAMFIDKPLSHQQLQLSWRPNAVNLHVLAGKSAFKSKCGKKGLCVDYTRDEAGLGAGYEWASRMLAGLHGTVSIYAIASEHTYSLKDEPVAINNKGRQIMPRLSLDQHLYLGRNFWATASGSAQPLKIVFAKIGLRREAIQSNLSVGVSYDFR